MRAGGTAEAPDKMLSLVTAAGDAEDEHDFLLLVIGVVDPGLQRRAGVQPRAGLARQVCVVERGRSRQRAVAADELGAVAGCGPRAFAHLHEHDAIGPFAPIRVARELCASPLLSLTGALLNGARRNSWAFSAQV